MWRRLLLAAAASLPVLLPGPVQAHAILESSTPTAGEAVPAGTVNLELRYNSRIDHARSRLILVGPDQAQARLPIAPDTAPQVLDATAELGPGSYNVRWQVLAVDGHITRGTFGFVVKAP